MAEDNFNEDLGNGAEASGQDVQLDQGRESQTPAAPPTSGKTKAEEIKDILDFDPFAPKADEKKPGEAGAQVPGKPAGEGAKAPAAGGKSGAQAPGQGGQGSQTPTPPPAATPTPPANPELELLKQQNQFLQQQLAQMRQPQQLPGPQGQQPQGQGQPAGNPGSDDVAALYGGINIPPQAIQALVGDDDNVRGQVLHGLLRGIAETVHRNLRKEFHQHVSTSVPHMIQQHTAQTQSAESQHSDFYGTFPHLNQPLLKPIVAQVGQQLMQELGQVPWSTAVRDLLGQRVNQQLAALGFPVPGAQQVPGPQGQQQLPNSQVPTRARQPFFAGGAPARLPAGNYDPNASGSIKDVLGF